ncbi:hypothetical protein ACET3Z_008623 [Daucus carota]
MGRTKEEFVKEEEESSDNEGPFLVRMIPVNYHCSSDSSDSDSSDSESEESNASPGENRNRTRNEAEINAAGQEPKIEEEVSDSAGPFPEPFPVRMIPVNYHCSSDSSDNSSDSSDSDSLDSESEVSNVSLGKDRNRTRNEAQINAAGQEPNIIEEEVFSEPYPVRMIPVNYHYSSDSSDDSSDDSDSDSEESNASPGEDRNTTRGEAEINARQEQKIVEEEVSDSAGSFPEPFPVRMIPVNYHYSSDSTVSSDLSDSSESDSEESNASPGEDGKRTRGEAEDSSDFSESKRSQKLKLTNPCWPTTSRRLHLFWLNIKLNARQRLVIRILSEQRLLKNERLRHSFYVKFQED